MAATQAVTLIDPVEVPPGEDDRFLAGWQQAHAHLAGKDAVRAAELHRALRPDVDFRFVGVARVDSPQAGARTVADPALAAGGTPFPAHPGLYEVAREEGTPELEGGVFLIEPFELPEHEDERFLAAWDRARDVHARQRGYLGTRLHRSLGPADFRFVEIARWSSPLMVARARQRPEFQQAAQALPFASHPALYQLVRDPAAYVDRNSCMS
jgi:heme oxygenase (mycobilin-producing)